MVSDVTRATDGELLEAVGRLEVEALGELYRRHAAAVFMLAHQLLGAAGAEGATQDVFLYVWDHSEELLTADTTVRTALLDRVRLQHLATVEEPEAVDETRRLTDDERAVLELALQGLGYPEAATRLNLSSAAVDGLLRRALNKVYEARAAPTGDSSEPL